MKYVHHMLSGLLTKKNKFTSIPPQRSDMPRASRSEPFTCCYNYTGGLGVVVFF